jgi:hypothetical protein
MRPSLQEMLRCSRQKTVKDPNTVYTLNKGTRYTHYTMEQINEGTIKPFIIN